MDSKRLIKRWDSGTSSSASSTILTIFANSVFSADLVTSTYSAPSPFSVPANTSSPAYFSTGTDSPVIEDWSTEDSPRYTRPSAGISSPGRTSSRSPTARSLIDTSFMAPWSMRTAVCGFSAISAEISLRLRSIV
ncbi:hypothetical protein D3C71_1577780 [compost metagenome]